LRERLRELAAQRPRFGYRRLTALLRREGHPVNHKRIYRLYRSEGLAVRHKPRKQVASSQRPEQIVAQKMGQLWSMDFMHDSLANGGRFRTLNVLDTYSRECMAIEVDRSLPSTRVIAVLDRVIAEYGCPEYIRIDNGPEFVGQVLDQWAAQKNVRLLFIDPGKPMQNGLIESFNGKFRDECLKLHWFLSLEDAQSIIEEWRQDYNTLRPHSSLGNLAPADIRRHQKQSEKTLIMTSS
jgi:putative transposase